MFKIIGSDGRQYGPVSAEQLRQWAVEGRVTAQTLAQAEGSAQWKPLANFQEFAMAVTPSQPVPPVAAISTAQITDGRKSKIAAGLFGIFLGGFGVHRFYLGYHGIGAAQLTLYLAGIPLGCVTCGIGCILTAAAGIWGLIEGIMILAGSINKDANGLPLKD